MDIAYLHFYVSDADHWEHWFARVLQLVPVPPVGWASLGDRALQGSDIRILLSSPATGNPEVAPFLQRYAEGVADVALHVASLEAAIARLQQHGGRLLQAVRTQSNAWGEWRWCRVQAWGSLCHTLIEGTAACLQPTSDGVGKAATPLAASGLPWDGIDHAVLNVAVGELETAATWYEHCFGFVRQQQFVIATPQSGLRSLVLKHPQGKVTLPINEPTSSNSQIQEFLDLHHGSGIQHVALRSHNLVATVAAVRQQGMNFLHVPSSYYEQLRSRPGFWSDAGDWSAIAQQQILADWPSTEPRARLLQTFSQPLFNQPTFFWELIERQSLLTTAGTTIAEGFGEGNFQALFEAIEREQQQRGSL